jgi:methylmalonyl-CoA/ethylmalonyl-CoA epimerase
MTESSFALSRIGQIALTVEDLEKATAFYRDVLGMDLLFEVPGMAFFGCGDVRMLLGTAQGTDHPSTIIYYRVDDIGAACAALRQRGATIEREAELAHKAEGYELWLAFLRDPDGHMLALMSEVIAD